MDTFHHKPIKKFSLGGVILDEAMLFRLRSEYEKLILSEMRIAGYAQRIDISPDFTVSFNKDKKHFEFELSIYGIYVGKKKIKWIAAIDETKIIYIPQNKSSVFSQEVG
jgi:hypothetical protein